ncbi:MAG TPA: thioredoxin domain-containing protein [Pirellulales bacterium]|jgi:uncharacterized protein YyaL (SSP411 family)|nr:thioredoxin domain-containing protein [Pirellulales bacterium]
MPNRLATQSSPYLLQHAGNPVDWYPWGKDALERARAESLPIFLSIGYSACHWCHVMEHESFEDAEIARFLNEHFVCIKVDREERPDLDQIYMNAVQLMTGRGGWPMSVFLTPELKPFYGGTYWPPTARMGMPGFDQVLEAVSDAWKNRRADALAQANSLSEHLRQIAQPTAAAGPLDQGMLERAGSDVARSFDPTYGGFGSAPKFPHPFDLRLLLRLWRRHQREDLLHVVTFTLEKMAAGGIYDQLGGGFHRYSVDERWLVPHFEKMLYDNALLVPCYLEAHLVTGREDFARIARETCDYVLREMTSPEGGFYSTQDADSEGVEGKFFVWTLAEVRAILGEAPARAFELVYEVTQEGNFEHGQSILNRPRPLEACAAELGRDPVELAQELAESRVKLLEARERRVHPGLDDKVIVAWNGLMIDALAQAAAVLQEPRYLIAAQRAAHFLLEHARRPDGRLLHSWRRGTATLDAYLDDYVCLCNALVSLYEVDFDEHWISEACVLADLVLELFRDQEDDGFFFTASDHEELITRPKDLYDNATPSGNSVAALALLRLAKLSGRDAYRAGADSALRGGAVVAQQASRAAGQLLAALDMHLGPTPEIAILGEVAHEDTAAVLANLRHRYLPNKVVALRRRGAVEDPSPLAALWEGKTLEGPEPGVFICEHFVCRAPVYGRDAAIAAWDELTAATAASPRK